MLQRSYSRQPGQRLFLPSSYSAPGDLYPSLERAGLIAARSVDAGIWYPAADLSNCFQDAAGTTPCTAEGQPVGLMLDQQYRAQPDGAVSATIAGPELVANGTFDANAAGWSAFNTNTQAPSVQGGQLVVANNNSSTATAIGAAQLLSLVVGRRYLVSGLVRRINGDFAHLTVINAAGTTFVAQGAQIASTTLEQASLVFTATESTAQLYLRVFKAATTSVAGEISAAFDNISVRELPGYHATQATAGNRPTLVRLANGRWGLNFDGAQSQRLNIPVRLSGTAADNTMIVAAQTNSASAFGLICHGNATGNQIVELDFAFSPAGVMRHISVDFNAAVAQALGPLVVGRPVVFSSVKEGVTLKPFFEGIAGNWVNFLLANNSISGAVLGARFQAGAFQLFHTGPFHMAAMAAQAIPDPTRIAIERFAAAHAGAPYLG
jgi:hypothetical protein